MPADFNFYINRQGARGRQGIQGEQGFSPVITVNKNTASEYTLNIETIDGVFETENLKSNPLVYVEGAGNYVMYDPSTNTIYNSDVPDELVLRTDLATTEDAGIIRIAGAEDLAEDSTETAVTPKQLNDAIDGVEAEIPTDYVNLSGGQTVTGNKVFTGLLRTTGELRSDGTLNTQNVNISGLTLIAGQYQQVNFRYQVNGSNRYMIVQRDEDDHLRIHNLDTSYNARMLNETDVDGETVWINNQGQLQAKGEEFPDVIDGGIVYPALKTFTITTSNQDITISDNSVDVTDDAPGTSTISISSSTVQSGVTITINYEDNSIDRSGYSLSTYDSETGMWVTQEVGAATDVINNDNTTASIAGMTFTLDPDTLTITVS